MIEGVDNKFHFQIQNITYKMSSIGKIFLQKIAFHVDNFIIVLEMEYLMALLRIIQVQS